MTINPLSIIKNSKLYDNIIELRNAIFFIEPSINTSININYEESKNIITNLIYSDENKNGGFYKYYYDFAIDKDRSWKDPAGNNLLLFTIAQASYLDSIVKKNYIIEIINLILDDAKNKLSTQELNEFLNFHFIHENISYTPFYDNTPLTLAIKEGCVGVAKKLVQYGANVNDKITDLYGGFTPLHLAMFRVFFLNNTNESIELR